MKTALFCTLMMLMMWVALVDITPSRAESTPGIHEQIQDEKKALKKIESLLEKNKKRAVASQKKERSILTEVEVIDRRFNLLRKEAALLESNIKTKEGEARILSKQIDEVRLDIEKGRKMIRGRVRSLYKEKQGASLKILFASQDYPDLLRKIQYMKTIAQKEAQVLNAFKTKHIELEEKKNQLSEVVEHMIVDRESLGQKMVQSRSERKKKTFLLARVRKDRALFSQAVSEMSQSSREIQSLIRSLEKKKKALDAAEVVRFSKARGKLRWPNDGKVAALFGRQKHPKFNETIFRKGIEITPVRGGEVRSVFEGTVVFADWFRGYGMMVMIDHGENYYSLYAHLAKLLVGVGDRVQKNRTIGEIGGTGLSQEPKLYFEIRHQGKPTNPLSWLQKRK